MKQFRFFLFGIVAMLALVSCSSPSNQPQVSTVQSKSAYFPTQKFADALKVSAGPAGLEAKINEAGFHQVDLNKDGETDYLTVNEAAGAISVMDNDVTPAVEVAKANIANNQVTFAQNQYCDPGYNYGSHMMLQDMIMMHYLLSPHMSYYHSPYIMVRPVSYTRVHYIHTTASTPYSSPRRSSSYGSSSWGSKSTSYKSAPSSKPSSWSSSKSTRSSWGSSPSSSKSSSWSSSPSKSSSWSSSKPSSSSWGSSSRSSSSRSSSSRSSSRRR